MEKKIVYTQYEPSKNFLWLHTKNDNLVLEVYGDKGWEPVCNEVSATSNVEPVKVKLPELNDKCTKAALIETVKVLVDVLKTTGVIVE